MQVERTDERRIYPSDRGRGRSGSVGEHRNPSIWVRPSVKMMFANDGYRPSQTHIFNSFPDSAVDLNDDEDDGPIDLQSNPNPSDDSPTDSKRFWQIEFYQRYFSIDTRDVIERLAASMHPRPDKSHFIATVRMNPDLYGPVWVCITLILTIGISGNLSRYFYLTETDFQLDLSRITLSATVNLFVDLRLERLFSA